MRLCWNTNGDAIGDESYFINNLIQLKPNVVLIMENLGLANRVYDALEGKTKVIYRIYSDYEDSAWRRMSASEYVKQITRDGNKHLMRYILNEPSPPTNEYPVMFRFFEEVMDRLADMGYKSVVGNFKPGAFEPSDYARGTLDDYLRKLTYYSHLGIHYGGWHEYTGILLPFGVGQMPIDALEDRNRVQPSAWAKKSTLPFHKINGNMPPFWHILRSFWSDIRSQEIGIKPHYKIITEFGWDRMPDLASTPQNIYEKLTGRFGVPHPHKTMRGVNTLRNVFRYYFPEWSFDRSVFEQLKWSDGIYPETYIGILLFTWSIGTQDWDIDYGFNYAFLRELHQLLIQYAKQTNIGEPTVPTIPPTTIYPPFPSENDSRWKDAIGSPKNLAVNVRSNPTTTSAGKVVTTLSTSTFISILPEAASVQSDGTWYPIRIMNKPHSGWVRGDVFEYKLEPTLPTFPATDDSRWKEATAKPNTSAPTNIRSAPTTNSSINGRLTTSTPVYILVEAVSKRSDGDWYPIRIKGSSVFGWVRNDVFSYTITPVRTPRTISLELNFLATDAEYTSVLAAIEQLKRNLPEVIYS